MKFIDLITYIFIFLGTIVNITFGYVFKIEFEKIMINNIFFTVIFLLLNIIVKIVLKDGTGKIELSNNKRKATFQCDIPPISDGELKELSEEEDFKEINPADLYIKNNKKE